MVLNYSVVEDSWESLGLQEDPTSHPKGDQSWVFIGRTDVEAETPLLWPPDVKNWLIGKDPDAGKEWRREKGTTEDEMVGWHHQLNGYGFGWTLAVGEGQGGLACCSSWGHKELDTTERLNWTELQRFMGFYTKSYSVFTDRSTMKNIFSMQRKRKDERAGIKTRRELDLFLLPNFS